MPEGARFKKAIHTPVFPKFIARNTHLPCSFGMTVLAMSRPVDFEALIEEHQKDVWRYLRMLGCQPPEADDLTQETFVSVMKSGFKPRSRGETNAYLRTTAHNFFINSLRKSFRAAPLSLAAEAENAWLDATPDEGSDQRLNALRVCLESLDERARQVLKLRYEQQRPGDEIARTLGTTEDGVYSLLKRVRATLRECIERRVKA